MDSSSNNPNTLVDESGIDLSLLELNLQLSYEERLKVHQAALDMILELEEAGRRYYEKSK